jgi:outer membrane receptor protein involved in Fe transport
MKKISALLSIMLCTLLVSAQNPMLNRGGQNGGQMPTGRFYGKIVDATNKGIEAASVTLVTNRMDTVTKKMKDVIIGGMLSSKNGGFTIENVPLFGKYNLRITGIGFKIVDKPVAFDMPNRDAMSTGDMSAMLGAIDKDLGNIKIEVDDKVLSTVTVSSSAKPSMTLGIDRKIFNVDKNLTSAGGTGVDVMKNVPSVNVDIDGNVTLRNTAPTLFVDGRPTTLTLEQIPADAIESVEVITNPSAKFDASGGTAGILNIVMKKNRRVGYSGNLRANVDSRLKFGLGGDINVRQEKINVFAMGQYNQRKSISTGLTERKTLGRNDSALYTKQQDKSIGEGQFGFGRFGFDYFMDIRNTLTVTGNFARGGFEPYATSNIQVDSAINALGYGSSYQERVSNSEFMFRNKGAQVSFKHNFPKSGHEWSGDVTYNKGRNENSSVIATDYLDQAYNFKNRYNQLQVGRGENENVTLQTDYSNPISATMKIEGGARAQIRKINSENIITIAGIQNATIYNSQDNIYAAYATFSNRIKNFGYQLGMRLESSSYEGTLENKGQSFNTDFPISAFPSLFISQKLKGDDELQFNYSRRINRPNFFQLFPFTDYTDSLNISRGNPGLQPEFTNSLELSFSKMFKNKDNLLVSAYFKHTTDLITRIQLPLYDTVLDKVVPVNTYENANSSYVMGLELTSRNKVTKFWDMIVNANLFTSKIDLVGLPDPDQFPSYFFKLNNTFRLPKNFTFQLSGDYQSKTISSPGGRGSGGGGGMFGGGGMGGGSSSAAQGFIRPNYGVDAALRFDFMKNKVASLSLNVNDIFRTKVYDQHTETIYFVQDVQRRRDPQVFRLNFNYRFGKFDASLFKRKNTKSDSGVDMSNTNM